MNANFTLRMSLGCSILMAVCQSAALAGGMGGHVGGGNSGGSSFHSSNFSAVRSTPVQKVQSLNTNTVKLQNNAFHVTPNSSSSTGLKLVPTNGILQPTGGTTTTGGGKFPIGGITQVPTGGILQPTGGTTTTGGGKFPIGGITQVPTGGILQPVGGGTTTTGGGKFPIGGITQVPTGGILQPVGGGTTTTPPTGGGSTPPSGGSMPPSCPTGGNCNPGKYCGSNWLWFNPGFYGNWGYGNGSSSGYGSSSSSTPAVYNNETTAAPVVADQPVANAASKLTMKLGQSYTIVNDHFGEKAGDLSLAISGLTLPVRVDQWDARQITFTVPFVGLDKATDGMFQIAGADHKLSKAVDVMVVAAK